MKNHLPDACIFDLDGVICDTAKYHYLAWKKLADSLGITFTEDDNEQLKGVSRIESLKILLSLGDVSFSENEMIELAKKKNNWYKEYIRTISEDEILEGVLDFIKQLKKDNIKIALGSVSKNAPEILENLKITSYFDAIIDGNVVTKAKPAPDVFLAGAEALSLPPSSCLVFEDAVSGVVAAHSAGMKCIGIGKKEILSSADYVITDFKNHSIEELVTHLI